MTERMAYHALPAPPLLGCKYVRRGERNTQASCDFVKPEFLMCPLKDSNTVFAPVICALFFSILAAEKTGCVKYADFFWRS